MVRLTDRLDMTITVDHFDLLQAGLGETPPAEYGCQTYCHRYMVGSTGNDRVSPGFLKLCWCRGKRVWLQSLKQFLINVPYHILIGSLTLMALS